MKKYIYLLLVISLLISSGCSIPLNETLGEHDNESSNTKEGSRINMQDEETKTGGLQQDDATRKTVFGKVPVTLYYQDSQGNVIPITRQVDKQEGMAKLAISAIIDNALNREEIEYFGVYPVLPQGTEVRGIKIIDGTAVIDFNPKLLNYKDAVAERNIVSSVVYTLTEFKTVKNVKILVNGYEQDKLKFSSDISGEIGRNNILINANKINLKSGYGKLDAYLFKDIGDKFNYLLPVSLEFSTLKPNTMPFSIMDALCKKYKGFYTEIPEGTKLLKSNMNGNTLILDFNKKLVEYGGNSKEDAILKQILFSMKQVSGVNNIKLLVEGNEARMPEGTDVSSQLPVPHEINKIIDDNHQN